MKDMKASEKSKAQQAISRIQSGDFHAVDVDSLLITLRPYSGGSGVFREIADLVAHNNERDRGIANESLEGFYLTFRYFLEYVSPNLALDLETPFPLYIRKLILYQVNKCDESELSKHFKLTRHKLDIQIRNLFKEDRKNKTSCLTRKIKPEIFAAIQFLLERIYSLPSFTQEILIDEIIRVVDKNALELNEVQFRSQESKITLCILLLFHNVSFNFNGYKFGSSKIACGESSSDLQVWGSIILNKDGVDITFLCTLITTNLKVEDWCDETLFSLEPVSQDEPNLLLRRVNFELDIDISDDFKLCKAIS
ncbi:MAG: hypothetical protein J0L70_23685 [Leptolyngbya sp. UWPOB_LEPTO1]|uniref:hypothetical protein n=1 Tax=Leptolyngbya sp. UWPOB_LEPTO1 TaxID=2815653 RepID=UPI001AC7377A|nr:hypothetical protein [Leptolyngbya sp. UWPOB_LEPTO1]MBN8563545.1 hypothetical protein [Leptolyngbya sp. UWPOB_LEPTO1]